MIGIFGIAGGSTCVQDIILIVIPYYWQGTGFNRCSKMLDKVSNWINHTQKYISWLSPCPLKYAILKKKKKRLKFKCFSFHFGMNTHIYFYDIFFSTHLPLSLSHSLFLVCHSYLNPRLSSFSDLSQTPHPSLWFPFSYRILTRKRKRIFTTPAAWSKPLADFSVFFNFLSLFLPEESSF